MSVRTRFAPSPTGQVHIGNIRTALYSWLFARHNQGVFLLRVEDTDRERSTPEAVDAVLKAMDWLGLRFDEEPLYQSTRREAHLEAAESLIASGHAYREEAGDKAGCILFKMPGDDMAFTDLVKGPLQKKAEDMQDLVIVRSNRTPVFHLANVVDDIHMHITHVIRGDDHVENTFRHIALYRALGADLPQFAHLPMIVNARGKPYSKRDGDAYVGDFREHGYLPEALFNFLVLLGWSPGDDREILSRDELVALFDTDRVLSSAAQFDLRKLEWMNGQYIRHMRFEAFRDAGKAELEKAELLQADVADTYLDGVLQLMQERLKFINDITDQAKFFFSEDYTYDEKAVRKRLQKEGNRELLEGMADQLSGLDDFTAEAVEFAVNAFAEAKELGAGKLFPLLRIAVTGQGGGPGLFEIVALLGKDRVLARLARTAEVYHIQ